MPYRLDLADTTPAGGVAYYRHTDLLADGLRARQQSAGEAVDTAACIRQFEPLFVPGYVQSPAWIRAIFSFNRDNATGQPPADIEQAVTTRLQRQQTLLNQGTTRLHVVMAETALRVWGLPGDVLTEQIDLLRQAVHDQRLQLGILQQRAALPAPPSNQITLYDDEQLRIELEAGLLVMDDPDVIAAYRRSFDDIAAAALYGAAAAEHLARLRTELLDSAEQGP
ncbi:Scr1 family TA system antitoxin-like transcriptional regulator [Catenulispora pinisilvae]|uniref:Scr1 family TA system antitoxin-like transcriptional regulator n=1 Tax=Catenulispora pinisilvae TaxID=2705253 RepID=UPI001890E9CE|nr:Scr1 family TA system antitoxin-like transcriptional regulator [Catenulispora pinisilvae]